MRKIKIVDNKLTADNEILVCPFSDSHTNYCIVNCAWFHIEEEHYSNNPVVKCAYCINHCIGEIVKEQE